MKNFYDSDLYKDLDADSTYSMVLPWIQPSDFVLDVGCATGYFGSYISKELGATVVGVDYYDKHIEQAGNTGCYSELFCLDLNTVTNELDKYIGAFDKIVVLDVLEHTNDPQSVLKTLTRLLKRNGQLIASVPNVSHGSIKCKIMLNAFEYEDKGILDRTHLRFFSLSSFVAMLSSLSLRVQDMDYVLSNKFASKAFRRCVPHAVYKAIINDDQSYVFQFVVRLCVDDSVVLEENLSISTFSPKVKRRIFDLKRRMTPFGRIRLALKRYLWF